MKIGTQRNKNRCVVEVLLWNSSLQITIGSAWVYWRNQTQTQIWSPCAKMQQKCNHRHRCSDLTEIWFWHPGRIKLFFMLMVRWSAPHEDWSETCEIVWADDINSNPVSFFGCLLFINSLEFFLMGFVVVVVTLVHNKVCWWVLVISCWMWEKRAYIYDSM